MPNTISGKVFEKKTILQPWWKTTVEISKPTRTGVVHEMTFSNVTYLSIGQECFIKYMTTKNFKNPNENLGHGCKKPDELYLDEKNKIMFWIEKKNQMCSGSVSEKLQTVHFKKHCLENNFPEFQIEYIFMLSNFFKTNHKSEINYLINNLKVPVFFESEENKLIKYMEMKSMEIEAVQGLIGLKTYI